MDPAGKVVVVTGAAAGMGAALCRALASAGACVVVSDIDGPGAKDVAAEIGGHAVTTDCSDEPQVARLAGETLDRFGRVDIFVSNAGILWGEAAREEEALQDRGSPWASNAAWQRVWDVNVMSQVYAARAVLPHMLERGSGYLVQNASAAGLLTALGNAPYATSKHAVVGLTEWLSIHYGQAGIAVSCIVAEGVRTAMLRGAQGEWFAAAGAIEPADAARAIVAGIRDERFLILTHPKVEGYFQGKAADYDGWLARMRRLHARTPR
jgi:NAD(P)-dependent dehydrogenase (short-subunit alcohol dehydrogenase family)